MSGTSCPGAATGANLARFTPVRFTGSAVADAPAGILGAAFAATVAGALIATFDSSAPVAVSLIALTAVSAPCVLPAPETRHLDLSREDHR